MQMQNFVQKPQARNERRLHRERIKARRKRTHRWWFPCDNYERALGKLVNTTTPCSCWMCGNPRRKRWLADDGSGLTIQERMQRDFAKSSLAETTSDSD